MNYSEKLSALTSALNNKTLVSFIKGNEYERDVKIVYINGDDIANKDFLYVTKKGERYNGFVNNIIM
jgi:hypothetical protein